MDVWQSPSSTRHTRYRLFDRYFFFIDFDFSLVSSFQTHSTLFAGIKYGGWTEWDYCWQRYKETTVPDERLNFLRALAASNDPWILQQ